QTRTSITRLLTGPIDLTEGLLAVKQGSEERPPRMTLRCPGGQLGGRLPWAAGDQPVALHTLPRTRARSGPVVARLRAGVGSRGGRDPVGPRPGPPAPPTGSMGISSPDRNRKMGKIVAAHSRPITTPARPAVNARRRVG